MSVYYYLVNQTKKEIISFFHIPAWKKCELAGNPISAAIVTWYLLENLGDTISFVNNGDIQWPFKIGSVKDLEEYSEITDKVVDSLVNAKILKDEGRVVYDDDEPELFYDRILKNIWYETD